MRVEMVNSTESLTELGEMYCDRVNFKFCSTQVKLAGLLISYTLIMYAAPMAMKSMTVWFFGTDTLKALVMQ